MLSYNKLRSGIVFVYNGQPYKVLDSNPLKMQQRRPVMQTRMRNLLTGAVLQQNFYQSEKFEEADIEKRKVKFLYANRGEFWFCEGSDRSKRFSLTEDRAGFQAKYIRDNTPVQSIHWNGEVITVIWPIKSEVSIQETVPGERGNTTSGGTKAATLETGAIVQVPLFINIGDIIRLNTETGEYTERVEKAAKGI